MAHLYFSDVSNSTKKSTETIFEIKAPLATFDTIDLDDWEEGASVNTVEKENQVYPNIDKSEKGIDENPEKKTVDKKAEPSLTLGLNQKKKDQKEGFKHFEENINASQETGTPTPTVHRKHFDNLDTVSTDTINSENENNSLNTGGTRNEQMDNNDNYSSENCPSAEDIQAKLKQKGKKHKEKTSSVKYEKIDSTSDISDQGEVASPVPSLKLKDNVHAYDSNSSDSDSDSGFTRGGFVKLSKGIGKGHLKAVLSDQYYGTDSADSDSTPCNSPKVSRPTLPPPLSKEDAAKRSKKKAYEKRLQRLQVTTKPIERPRSTTPISIHGLDEYVHIGSPEKSPAKSNLEKLTIKLPLEEIGKMKSPKRMIKSSGPSTFEDGDPHHVFNFNEDLLFTRTKAAILLEEDSHGTQSPKRILVPPTLSPKLSPVCSPRTGRDEYVKLPKYVFSPKSSIPNLKKETEQNFDKTDIEKKLELNDNQNWAKFDELPTQQNINENVEIKSNAQVSDHGNQVEETELRSGSDNKNEICKDYNSDIKFSDDFDELNNLDELEKDEILTVEIDKGGEVAKCDIEFFKEEESIWELNPRIVQTEQEKDNHLGPERNCSHTNTVYDNQEKLETLC